MEIATERAYVFPHTNSHTHTEEWFFVKNRHRLCIFRTLTATCRSPTKLV